MITRRTVLKLVGFIVLLTLCFHPAAVSAASKKRIRVVMTVDTGSSSTLSQKTIKVRDGSTPLKALTELAKQQVFQFFTQDYGQMGMLLIQTLDRRNENAAPIEGNAAVAEEGKYWMIFRGPAKKIVRDGEQLELAETTADDLKAYRFFLVGASDGLSKTALGMTTPLVPDEIRNDPSVQRQLQRLLRQKVPTHLVFGYVRATDFSPANN